MALGLDTGWWRASLNGFFIQVHFEGRPFLLDELYNGAPLHAGTLHTSTGYSSERDVRLSVVYIPGGNTLIFSRRYTRVSVRDSELVKYRDGVYHFGRFFPEGSAPRGGFIPILWDAPKSDTYAVQDIGLVVEHVRACFGFTAR